MKHNIKNKKLNKTSSHRKAMFMNLSNSLTRLLAASEKTSPSDSLISSFTGKNRSKIKVPLTILPSSLSEEEIDKLS